MLRSPGSETNAPNSRSRESTRTRIATFRQILNQHRAECPLRGRAEHPIFTRSESKRAHNAPQWKVHRLWIRIPTAILGRTKPTNGNGDVPAHTPYPDLGASYRP